MRRSAAQLAPLDNDPDFIYYGALFGWGGAPDFQPRFQQMCTTDRTLTDKACSNSSIAFKASRTKRRHVPSVAETMDRAFLGLYQRALAAFQAILKQQNPPAPPQMIALAQSQIPELQTKIAELKQVPPNDSRQAVDSRSFCRKGPMCNALSKHAIFEKFARMVPPGRKDLRRQQLGD